MNTEMSLTKKRLIRNAIRTPDGTILESRNRHDYKQYIDANGKTYAVDGGLDYIRRSMNGDEESLDVYSDDPHEIVREALEWGTYGKNGDEPYRLVKLKDMSTNHIQACLDTVPNMYPQVRDAFEEEFFLRSSEEELKFRSAVDD